MRHVDYHHTGQSSELLVKATGGQLLPELRKAGAFEEATVMGQDDDYICPECQGKASGSPGTSPQLHIEDCRVKLKADLTQARQERDHFQERLEQTDAAWTDVCDSLEKERDTLKAALRKFGQHLRECAHQTKWVGTSSMTRPKGCTCGLDLALGGTDE